ncbi:histidinol-phosphate transaminase [Hanseniaspora vineae]
MSFDLSKIVRPKIYNLEPYRCARDDFTEGILLDANENAHGSSITMETSFEDLNRYPDPHQVTFKKLMADYRNSNTHIKGLKTPLTYENLCLGVGSDESIDALIRAVCVPGKDKILINPPTYGMYTICTAINDVECVKIPLRTSDNSFQLDVPKILDTLANDDSIKLVFITSPGNPTGAFIDLESIETLCQKWTNGFVVVDEAYIDFGGESSAPLVTKYPNIAVLQTLSKSFGLAGIRLGVTFTSKEFSSVLNAMKAPYNISVMASELAINALSPASIANMHSSVEKIQQQRARLVKDLCSLPYVEDVPIGGMDANFILIRMKNADKAKEIYSKLANESKVVIRYRGTELGCEGGLRITVGTEQENDHLIEEFKKVCSQVL